MLLPLERTEEGWVPKCLGGSEVMLLNTVLYFLCRVKLQYSKSAGCNYDYVLISTFASYLNFFSYHYPCCGSGLNCKTDFRNRKKKERKKEKMSNLITIISTVKSTSVPTS